MLNDFEELLLKEKISWRQKAKIQWAKEGDVNSKLFHKVATRRKRKSLIKELESGEGHLDRESGAIAEEITRFYKALYLEEN